MLYVCIDKRGTKATNGSCETVSCIHFLNQGKKKGNVVNLLGYFSPLVDDCELYTLLQEAGVKTIHEISRCEDFEEYKKMSEANFNLVLHPRHDLQQKIFMID